MKVPAGCKSDVLTDVDEKSAIEKEGTINGNCRRPAQEFDSFPKN